MDRSSTTSASGVGLLLDTPDKVEIEYAIHLKSNATNNEAEYEALIVGLSTTKEAGAECIAVYTDSKLVKG